MSSFCYNKFRVFYIAYFSLYYYMKATILLELNSILHTYKQEMEIAMFRLWAKEFKDNHMIKDTVIKNDTDDSRTHKVFQAIEAVCYEFDLGKPIWLESNITEFKRHSKARFTQDSFIEQVEFDYLEIQIIEE